MENEKRKLQVGDKLYKRGDNRWGRESIPQFASVVRLSATQALLSNGVRLKNEIRFWSEKLCFSEVGKNFEFWYFETPEIVEEAKRLKEESRIRRWFELKKWDIEEMKLVYETFKEKNLLNEAKEN